MINKVTDATVFINGSSRLGLAEEVDLPRIEGNKSEHNALGMLGTYVSFSALVAMEMRIKWAGQSSSVASQAFNPYQTFDFQVRAVIETNTGSGITRQSVVNYLKGRFNAHDPGNFAPNTNVENESMISIDYFRQEINRVSMVEIDIINNIYVVNGVDVLAEKNKMLGIAN